VSRTVASHRAAGTPELSRRLRTSMCFFWGRCNLPLPRKHDILSAVGPTVAGASAAAAYQAAACSHVRAAVVFSVFALL